ncbi:hypothetical protein CFAM422_002248 [Trichoderma lentiforme]|uniref:Uncharacterized protein n=1 Tax=Trichoderma lentiforme TaxID=1567552 RepID=A0A9P4XNZ9_9HYPO|nr:hypothetical protein CFAM422_002248 [Trichoderma lentiforme]
MARSLRWSRRVPGYQFRRAGRSSTHASIFMFQMAATLAGGKQVITSQDPIAAGSRHLSVYNATSSGSLWSNLSKMWSWHIGGEEQKFDAFFVNTSSAADSFVEQVVGFRFVSLPLCAPCASLVDQLIQTEARKTAWQWRLCLDDLMCWIIALAYLHEMNLPKGVGGGRL